MITKGEHLELLVELKYNLYFSFSGEHCSSIGLRRTLKVFVLFENVKLLESCFVLFFVMDTHFETHNADVITRQLILLTIMLHDTTKCYDLSLRQCFTGIYMYKHT